MRQILYIGNKLEKHGVSPTSVDILAPALQEEGFEVKAISSKKNKTLRLLHMLWSVIENYTSKDLVLIDTYSTTNFWYAVLCGRLCQFFSIPYIFFLHGGNLKNRFESTSPQILKIFKNAKACVVPSCYLKDQLKSFSFKNLKYIPNSIDLSFYDFNQRIDFEPKLLWVRSFAEVYNPEMALIVMEKILQIYPQAELCMVGPEKDGSLKKLKTLAEKKKLPVKFTGKLDKKDWIALSRDYDIFLNTTNVDNTPVSVMEAMALGLPVVSTNAGGIPYLIENGVNGILVEPNKPEAMTSAVQALIDDPALARRLSAKAREKVESFDWEQVKPLWLELLG